MRVIALVVVLALVAPLAGCSLFLTRGPDQGVVAMGGAPAPYPPDCTDSMVYPIVDGVVTTLAILGIVSTIGGRDSADNTRTSQAIGSALIIGGAFGTSAYIGYGRVNRCRSARTQWIAANPGWQPVVAPSYPQAGFPTTAPASPSPYIDGPAQPQPPQPYVPPGTPQQPAPAAQPRQTQQPRPSTLGVEGDVCNAQAECSAGLVCASNLCVKPPRRAQK